MRLSGTPGLAIGDGLWKQAGGLEDNGENTRAKAFSFSCFEPTPCSESCPMKRFIIAAALAAAVSISFSSSAHADPNCPSLSEIRQTHASGETEKNMRRQAEAYVKSIGISGEKAAVVKKHYVQAGMAQWKNRRFIRQFQTACRRGTGAAFAASWLEWHRGRNIWRLSYEDQRTYYLFRSKILAQAPSAKVCAEYAYGEMVSRDGGVEMLRRTFNAMSVAELDAVFGMATRAAKLEDTDDAPSLDLTGDQEKALQIWMNHFRENTDKTYPKKTAERLKNYMFGDDPGDDRTRCLAEEVGVRAALQLRGQSARSYMQWLANMMSSKYIQQRYPGLPESER